MATIDVMDFDVLEKEFVGMKAIEGDDDITKTAGYREAMADIRAKRIYHADNADDMFKQILG